MRTQNEKSFTELHQNLQEIYFIIGKRCTFELITFFHIPLGFSKKFHKHFFHQASSFKQCNTNFQKIPQGS